MIKDRRWKGNFIEIDFIPKELFQNYPYKSRLTLTLVTDGEWEFILNTQKYKLSSPFIMCLSENDRYELINSRNSAAKSFSFAPTFVNSELTWEALQKNEFDEIENMHDRNLVQIFTLRNQWYTGILELDSQVALQINTWLSVIGTECLSQSDGRWTCRIRRYLIQTLYLLEDEFYLRCNNEHMDKKPIDYALEYIHSNYNLGLTLSGISKYVGMNRTSLNKSCKEKTGLTVIQYLNHYRIKMAKEALSHTNLKLNEISLCCGYNYESYFTKIFTEKTGMSPTEYRKKYRD